MLLPDEAVGEAAQQDKVELDAEEALCGICSAEEDDTSPSAVLEGMVKLGLTVGESAA